MIPVFDDTTPFIWAAYALSTAVLAALGGWTLARAGAAKRRLEAAEREQASGR